MNIRFNDCDYQLERYPVSQNRSLQAVSAADRHLLMFLEEGGETLNSPVIYHDRFGALTVALHSASPITVIEQKSQEISIQKNLAANGLSSDKIRFAAPLEPSNTGCSHGLIRVPKSLELFRLYLQQLTQGSGTVGTVICSFMNRYFTPQLLTIAGEYYESVLQSRAWRKSRLLILSGPKTRAGDIDNLTVTRDSDYQIRQYPGVFSAKRIDGATRLLIDSLDLPERDRRILDLGCGNGVIGAGIRQLLPEAEIHLLDDSWLAVESAKLNLDGEKFYFHWADTADGFDNDFFDLVVSNPPFHFEYEIDISVPLSLFKETRRILRPGGVFLLVANRHLNYRTQLIRLFTRVTVVSGDDKYEVLRCE